MHIDFQYHFVLDMVEDKRVLLEKVDTLKKLADALKKSMNTKNFSHCRHTIGIAGLDRWLSSHVAPCEIKTTSGRMLGVCYIISMTRPTCGGIKRGEISPSYSLRGA